MFVKMCLISSSHMMELDLSIKDVFRPEHQTSHQLPNLCYQMLLQPLY